MGSPLKDCKGLRFGKWLVVRRVQKARANCSSAYWLCRCECGTERILRGDRLRSGRTQSCGCAVKTVVGSTGAVMGEGNIWCGMLARCYDPSCLSYPQYGARGIRVCDRWRGSFADFYADMGPRPSKWHTLDRIDNQGNYAPGNCRWAIWEVQARNRRNTIFVEWKGQTVKLADLLEGKKYSVKMRVYARLYKGCSIEEAFDPAPQKRGPKSKRPARQDASSCVASAKHT